MNLETQGWIILIYLVPAVLFALWFSGNPTRHPWQVITVLGLLPMFYALHFLLLERLPGWPSDAPLPDRFQLMAHQVYEPDAKTGDPGEIVIWLQAEDTHRPRAHAVPYDAGLHRRLSEAASRLAEGIPQLGEQRATDRPSVAGTASDTTAGHGHLIFRNDEDRHLPPKVPAP